MRVTVVGPHSGLIEEIVGRLDDRNHEVIEPDGDLDVVIDVAEPGDGASVDGASADGASADRASADRASAADRTAAVGELLAQTRPARYVLVSSVLVYAPVPDPTRWPIRESFPRRAHGDPASRAYGQACIDAEDLLMRETSHIDVEYVVLRPTMIVGSQPNGFADQVLDEISRQPWVAAGRYAGVGTMQWIDVEDAAEAVVLAAEAPAAADQVFTVAGTDAFTSRELAQVVVARRDPEETSIPKFTTIKAATMLGWTARNRISPTTPGARPHWTVTRPFNGGRRPWARRRMPGSVPVRRFWAEAQW